MKNFLKYVAALAIVGAFFVACSDWTDPEREITQHPDQQSPILRDNAYYQALREYKKTKHKIAFGWYGSWTAVGASYQTRLQSAPDSMDIISIWSQWHSLTPEQIADKEFVQKIKGTNTEIRNRYWAVMPNVKWTWLNLKIVSLYSRAAVGAVFSEAESGGESEHATRFAYQVSPVGVTVGGRLAAYAEAGVGASGSLLVGLRYSF